MIKEVMFQSPAQWLNNDYVPYFPSVSYAKLRQGFNTYLISTNVTWEAISEKFEDYLSGVRMTFTLSVVRDYGACAVPSSDQGLFDNTFDNTFN